MINQQQKLWTVAEPELAQDRIHSDSVPLSRVMSWEIARGLRFLSSQHGEYGWGCSRNGSAVWTTAYILARLAELPIDYMTHGLRQQIQDSLDWLATVQTPGGGWSFAPEEMADDAGATAWAILAFRRHGRQVPVFAQHFLRRCHQPDGTFSSQSYAAHSPEIAKRCLPATAIVIQALGIVTSSSSGMLEEGLHAAERQSSQTDRLFVCADVLDWPPGAAPASLLDEVRQAVPCFAAKSALEQALLLRCLVQLRMQTSWMAAARLSDAQQADGSWRGPAMFPEDAVISTATAISALAMRDLESGVCFGIDSRLPELKES